MIALLTPFACVCRNEVLKVFTLITTVFCPLQFFTAYFGMNFANPKTGPSPDRTLAAGVVLVLSVMTLAPACHQCDHFDSV
jgi:Mg2+ and Co2+ transporter CorA